MKYYIALYQKLKDIYTSQSSQENDVALICPSLRLYEKEDLELLKPLQKTDTSANSILKKQQVSYELNSLPVSNNFWDLNPNNTLFDAFGEILEHATIKNLEDRVLELDETEKEKLYDSKNKQTKEYKAYQKQLLIYQETLSPIEEHLAKYDTLISDDEKLNWQNQLSVLHSKKEQAFADLEIKGYKNLIETALEKLNKNTEIDAFLEKFQNVKMTFDAAEKTDVTTNSALHDINFIPFDFMENESGWTSLKLTKTDLDALFEEAKKHSENLPSEILSLDYDEKYITGIELDYSFIHLKRNWFNKSIFNSKFFQWTETKPISDGVNISSAFKLPAFTKTMILIKNLKINLDPTISENQVNNPNQLIYFGPLVLKQQLFINKSSDQKFLKAVTNKETIKSDQLNYLIKKSDPVKVETVENTIITPKATIIADKPIRMRTVTAFGTTTPVVDTPKPVEISTIKPIFINPVFIKDLTITPVQNTAPVFFKINDTISKKGIYKTGISIKGTDNNRVFEIESNETGDVKIDLPLGNYKVELKADGYAVLNADFKVENTNVINLNYSLKREEVSFKSYFLIGMICEKIPKTPL